MTQRTHIRSGGPRGQVARARTGRIWRPARLALGTASVLALAGPLGGCAAPAVDDGSDRAVPAGAGIKSPQPAPTTSPAPSDAAIDPGPAPGKTPSPTPIGGQPWDPDATAACEQELADQGLAGLHEVAQTANDDGISSFWVAGRQWVLCDRMWGPDAPPPTLVSGSASRGFDEKGLGLSSTIVTGQDGRPSVRFAAGGRLPWPVHEISYTFPDGHTQNAAFVASDDGSADTWWSVTYAATDGVLVDPDAEPAELEPLEVSVVGGAAEGFRVPWDEAVRSQRNE